VLDRFSVSGYLVVSAVYVLFSVILGFFTGALYTLVALQTSGDDWQRFWMGNRAPDNNYEA